MEMSHGEIQRNYEQAKDKKRQVKILADLNDCKEEQILEILDVKSGKKKEPVQKDDKSDTAVQALYEVLDELETKIRNLEEKYKSVKMAIDVLAERKEKNNRGKEAFN